MAIDPEVAVARTLMMNKQSKKAEKVDLDKAIQKQGFQKSVKQQKMDRVEKLVKKEREANKKFKNFGGRISLGKFAILDESDDEVRRSPKQKIPVQSESSTEESLPAQPLKTSNNTPPKPKKSTTKPKVTKTQQLKPKSQGMSIQFFIVGITLGVALLFFKRYLNL